MLETGCISDKNLNFEKTRINYEFKNKYSHSSKRVDNKFYTLDNYSSSLCPSSGNSKPCRLETLDDNRNSVLSNDSSSLFCNKGISEAPTSSNLSHSSFSSADEICSLSFNHLDYDFLNCITDFEIANSYKNVRIKPHVLPNIKSSKQTIKVDIFKAFLFLYIQTTSSSSKRKILSQVVNKKRLQLELEAYHRSHKELTFINIMQFFKLNVSFFNYTCKC